MFSGISSFVKFIKKSINTVVKLGGITIAGIVTSQLTSQLLPLGVNANDTDVCINKNCSQCLIDPSCNYCVNVNNTSCEKKCMTGSMSLNFCPDINCGLHIYNSCLIDTFCGWCNDSNTCLEGTINGPIIASYCPDNNWVYNGTYSTPVPTPMFTPTPTPTSQTSKPTSKKKVSSGSTTKISSYIYLTPIIVFIL